MALLADQSFWDDDGQASDRWGEVCSGVTGGASEYVLEHWQS